MNEIIHIDVETFYDNILRIANDNMDDEQSPFTFDNYPCVAIPLTEGTSHEPKLLKNGEYWPLMAIYNTRSKIENDVYIIYPEETIDRTVVSDEDIENCKQQLRVLLPNITEGQFVFLSHSFDCPCCGRSAVNMIITTNDILDIIG